MKKIAPQSQKCYAPAQEGAKIVKYPTGEMLSWTRFFKRYRFFGFFHDFVRVDIVANSVEGNNENYLSWLGFVESKLFILLNLLAKDS